MAHHGEWKRLGDGSLLAEDFEEGLGHSIPVSTLMNILLILLFLTVVTVAVSRFDFGNFNLVVAMIIAGIKATIVGTYFMHLKFEGRNILMYVAYPLILLVLLIGGTLADSVYREKVCPSDTGCSETKLFMPTDEHHTEHKEGNSH